MLPDGSALLPDVVEPLPDVPLAPVLPLDPVVAPPGVVVPVPVPVEAPPMVLLPVVPGPVVSVVPPIPEPVELPPIEPPGCVPVPMLPPWPVPMLPLDGVPVEEPPGVVVDVPYESLLPPVVVVLSGDFAGSLPPHAATLAIASAVKRTYRTFIGGAPEFEAATRPRFSGLGLGPTTPLASRSSAFSERAVVHLACPRKAMRALAVPNRWIVESMNALVAALVRAIDGHG